MIPEDLERSLKQRYGASFGIEIQGQVFGFRPLTRAEYKHIDSSLSDTVDFEDAVVQTAVVYPQGFNFGKMKAGHVTQLANSILQCSGFTDPNFLDGLLKEARKEAADASTLMKAFVIATMPSYTDEDLDQFTMHQLIHKVALAERIISVQQATMGIGEEHAIFFGLGLEEPEEEVRQVAPVKKKQQQPEKLPSRENLLSTIRSSVAKQGYDGGSPVDDLVFSSFDDESLTRAAGIPRPDDPISRKLREAMG